MLLLTFRAAESLYAVDAASVMEVVPRVDLRKLPHVPGFLAGVFDYRGTVVPVIDLGILLGSVACRDRLSTRIILVQSRSDDHNQHRYPGDTRTQVPEEEGAGDRSQEGYRRGGRRRQFIGIIAEQVSDLASIKPDQVISSPMHLPQAPYLAEIVDIDGEMAQLIVADKVLDESLREALFEDGSVEARRAISEAKAHAESS